MVSPLQLQPSRIELQRQTRGGLPLTRDEARTYAAVLAVAQRHGISGTDAQIEAAIKARPDLHPEIRRTLRRHEDGWNDRANLKGSQK